MSNIDFKQIRRELEPQVRGMVLNLAEHFRWVFRGHPKYADPEDLVPRAMELFEEKVFPKWKPESGYTFWAWWNKFGYLDLYYYMNCELADTDPRLFGAFDKTTKKWRQPSLQADGTWRSTTRQGDFRRAAAELLDLYLPDREGISKRLSDRDNALLWGFLETGSLSEGARRAGMSKSWAWEYLPKLLQKAAKAREAAQDERLGVLGKPRWDPDWVDMKRLERQMQHCPARPVRRHYAMPPQSKRTDDVMQYFRNYFRKMVQDPHWRPRE